MRRDQLEHAIRTACQIIGQLAVIVVGSQSILGTFDEDVLPDSAQMSREIDILPMGDDNDEVQRLADLIEGVAGEFSACANRRFTSAGDTTGPRARRSRTGSLALLPGQFDKPGNLGHMA